jgi:mycofactocin precursor
LCRQRKKAYNVDDWNSGKAMHAEGREAIRMRLKEDQRVEEREELKCKNNKEEADRQGPDILEEIEIEDFAVDGICGVY